MLDSVGIGELPDANEFQDGGSHTLGNIHAVKPLKIPLLTQMGLGNIKNSRLPETASPSAAYGKLAELTKAKDTTCGHWELMGLPLDNPFKTFPYGFSASFMAAYEDAIGRKTIGNTVASGTEIIKELGDTHVKTGFPIIYTSADSVFQVAAHEDVIPLPHLYEMCQKAYDLLDGQVGRVIARPFTGESGDFKRTENRKDFACPPPADTVLNALTNNGIAVHAIGKIEDIFSNIGITTSNHTTNNADGITATADALKTMAGPILIFTNLVDFDMLYGHRNDAKGYAKALEYFDTRLPEILSAMQDDDLLIITADHGCDPTTASTDHTREYVPCLVAGKRIKPTDLKTRATFADVGATVCDYFGLDKWWCGESLLKECMDNWR